MLVAIADPALYADTDGRTAARITALGRHRAELDRAVAAAEEAWLAAQEACEKAAG